MTPDHPVAFPGPAPLVAGSIVGRTILGGSRTPNTVPIPDPTPDPDPAHAAPHPEDPVSERHAAIDEATSAYARRSGLACPPGCGACCHSPDVETTIVDVRPLAGAIVARGGAIEVIERIRAAGDRGPCVLFEPDADDPARGRCSMYRWRPSICRLFGFSGRRRTDGTPEPIVCRVHARTIPAIVEGARLGVADGSIPLPILADHARSVAMLGSGDAAESRPINAALRTAIEEAALRARLRSADEGAGGPSIDDGTSTTPKRPRGGGGRRRAA